MRPRCADEFDIKIIGKGGHAAHPHLSIDPIAIASTVVSSIQQVVSRVIDPLENIVITIGKINGGFQEMSLHQRLGLKALYAC